MNSVRMVKAAICTGLLLFATSLMAESMSFSDLPKEQQRVLENYESRWSELSAGQQERLRLGSERWLRLTPEQRQDTIGRFQRWQNLTPNQQRNLRQRLETFR
ncbi:MAG: DUF3106 domain-containing protein, partial [Pseudomonadota bacterium]